MKRCVFALCWILLVAGCTKKPDETPAPKNLPTHTLVYGGDVFLGGGFSRAVYSKADWGNIFGELTDRLKNADIAVVNGEGVISSGGMFAYKDDSFPLYYRAHPNAADFFKYAGIDIVTVGNNHAGDYGKDAFREELDRLSSLGIDYAGGGYNQQDARTPVVRIVGDTGIAVVGADMTATAAYAATWNTPGTLFFANTHMGRNLDEAVKTLTEILGEARKKADVVLFSPHWGLNWKTGPTDALQSLAERLIEAGYDGILGHSAHLPHGVGLIDGKPVIYDAGNLLLNYGPRKGDHGEHRSVLYELEFTKAGITEVRALPLLLQRNQARPAPKKEAGEILAMLEERSKALGTELVVEDGMGVVRCDPGGIRGPKTPAAVNKKRTEPIRTANSHLVLDALPSNAKPVNVRFENGLRLVGYRLIGDALPFGATAQVAETFWTATDAFNPDDDTLNLLVHMEAVQDKTDKAPDKYFAGHLPGDWILPASAWPKGKLIRDVTYFRLTFSGREPVRFYTGLWNGNRLLGVTERDESAIVEDNRVLLGTTAYGKDAPSLFKQLDKLRADLEKEN